MNLYKQIMSGSNSPRTAICPHDLKILRPELERRNLKAVACDVMLPLEDLALWPVIKEEALKDVYPTPFDKPLPIAKRTRAYLREIGIG